MNDREYFETSIGKRQDPPQPRPFKLPASDNESISRQYDAGAKSSLSTYAASIRGNTSLATSEPTNQTVLQSPSPQFTNNFSNISLSSNEHSLFSDCSKCTSKDNTKTEFTHGRSSNNDANGSHRAAIETISPVELAALLGNLGPENFIIIDLRNVANYQRSRIKNSLNLSVPTTLLKRPLYTLQKLIESLPNTADQERLKSFDQKNVVIYDTDSFHVGPGTAIHQFALKFWSRDRVYKICLVQGGFAAIARDAAALLSSLPIQGNRSQDSVPLGSESISIQGFRNLSCTLPEKQTPVNPFFNNIRQNQDLIGGVGDPIPFSVPVVPDSVRERLPYWLRSLVFDVHGPQKITEKFLAIELEEQARMQRVLQAGASFQNDPQGARHSVAAGVERGDKNRYNNIWPFEDTRVRLGTNEVGASDYVNASHIHATDSRRHYIATQGPLPGTTKDFWQMIWENDVRIIVMLTKTNEGGQAKCHPYWLDTDAIKPYEISRIDESTIESHRHDVSDRTSLEVRKLSLFHHQSPLGEIKEITHIQLSEWPDFHVIEPSAILALLVAVHGAEENQETPVVKRRKSVGNGGSSAKVVRPILSHCSAGCGRTGVFCTIDTVLDLVGEQLRHAWSTQDNSGVDLIEQVVREFRDQRLSMVQTLRQFVLCYDTVFLYCIEYLRDH